MTESLRLIVKPAPAIRTVVRAMGATGPAGPAGADGSSILIDETNETRSGVWKLDDNEIYFDTTNTGPTTTRRGPFLDADQVADVLTQFVATVFARTTDPGIAGVAWNNGGVWTFSSGSVSASLDFSVSTNSQYIGCLN